MEAEEKGINKKMALSIEPVVSNDIELLTHLGRATFIESYAHLDDPVYFQKHLERNHTLEAIEKEFYTPRNHFFIARVDGQAVGFCKLVSDEHEQHPELNSHRCIELERMYVLKKFQGMHIGHALLGESLNFSARGNFEIIWLGVSIQNKCAIQIYEQWGFVYFDTHLFDLGGQMQTDWMMKRPVKLHGEREYLVHHV